MNSENKRIENGARANQLLACWQSGERSAYDELIVLLHDDLSQIAHRHFRKERVDHTLQTHDLVGMLYIKLLGSKTIPWTSYTNFLQNAAYTMRQILIDHSRTWGRRATGKNGHPLPEQGEHQMELVDKDCRNFIQRIVELNEIMGKIEKHDPLMAQIADLKIVLGLTHDEIAACLKIPLNKAKREWVLIKSLLAQKM